ncbi:MAG: hypothetical protein ACOCXJ_03740 [Planctomycetota bacterium]
MLEQPWSTLVGMAGSLLVLLAGWDILRTTMGVEGGLMTRWVPRCLWQFIMRIWTHPIRERRQRMRMRHVGVLVVLSTLCCWILVLWAGWTLLLMAWVPLQSSVLPEIVLSDYIAFAGSMLFTLGLGQAYPDGHAAYLAAPLACLTGLFIITYGITWLTSMISLGAARHLAARQIASLGTSITDMQELLSNPEQHPIGWSKLDAINTSIMSVDVQLENYPAGSYLASVTPEESFPLQLVRLCRALDAAREQTPLKLDGPRRRLLDGLRASIHSHGLRVGRRHQHLLQHLCRVSSDDTEAVQRLMLHLDGWTWSDAQRAQTI